MKLLFIALFIYNNGKNISIGYKFFKQNYKYYSYILFKYIIDFCLKF